MTRRAARKPNGPRLAILLVAALAAGAALVLTLGAAQAGLAFTNYLPVVIRTDPSATPTAQPSSTPTEAPPATATSQPTATQQPANCDHSYPTICIPYPPPDLDCPDIPYTNFLVVPPDDHHFDQDHDGIGCESP